MLTLGRRHRIPVNGKYLIERTWTGELSRRVSHIDGDERYMMIQYKKGEEKQQRVAESEERVPRAQLMQAPTKTRPARSQQKQKCDMTAAPFIPALPFVPTANVQQPPIIFNTIVNNYSDLPMQPLHGLYPTAASMPHLKTS